MQLMKNSGVLLLLWGVVVQGVCAQAAADVAISPDFTLGLALGQTQYRATERNALGNVTNQESGSLPRAMVTGRWQHGEWFAEAALSVARHDVAYQGFTQIGIPLTTTTALAMTQSGLQGGRRWRSSSSAQWQVSSGLERLQIQRHILPGLGSSPLREVLTTTRAMASVAVQQDLPATWVSAPVALSVGLDVMPALRSRLDVDSFGVFDPITLQPARSTDWRVKLKTELALSRQASLWLGYMHESLQPGGSSLEVWTRGGVPTAGVRYPGSQQSLRTLSMGLSLGF